MRHRDLSKKVASVLLESDELKSKVGNRIIPVGTDKNVKKPFVAFRRSMTSYRDCKFYSEPSVGEYEVVVVSDTYEEGVEISEIVESLFSQIVSSGEEFNEFGYMQNIKFNMDYE